jgi:hypothetical protein
MDQKKTQHYNYTHETIPIMWHNQTDDFLKYAGKDGVKFLRFWWKHLSDNMGITLVSSSEGLGITMKEFSDANGKSVNVILLSMPEPTVVGEVYYMLLSRVPKKRTFLNAFMAHIPNTRVLALQHEGKNDDGTAKTGLYELTIRARNIRVGDGCEPVKDVFYKSALAKLKLGVSNES